VYKFLCFAVHNRCNFLEVIHFKCCRFKFTFLFFMFFFFLVFFSLVIKFKSCCFNFNSTPLNICSLVFIGHVSPASCTQLYINAVQHIYAAYLQLVPRPPLIVNTMGWMKGNQPPLSPVALERYGGLWIKQHEALFVIQNSVRFRTTVTSIAGTDRAIFTQKKTMCQPQFFLLSTKKLVNLV